MIRSMTGFASIGRDDGRQRAGVTVKSVNHRFLDVQIKAPTALGAIDARAKALVNERLTRGRVEISIAFDRADVGGYHVALNEALLARLADAVETARAKGLLAGSLTTSDVLRLPQVLEIKSEGPSQGLDDEAVRFVETAVADALDALVVMRATEGAILERDLDQRLAALAGLVDEIEQQARAGQQALEARLRDRLATLPPDVQGDPAALAQEVVRVVARSDIDEELVRFRGHVAHWRGLAAGPEPCGRKLDFLVQEMNREINTMGSKAEGPRAPELVVAAKAELERVREQVQNVE